MKTWVLLLVGFILTLTATQVIAQPILGFTNADGFPNVVSNSGHYTLSGWIANRGNQPFTGVIEVRIRANNGTVTQVSTSNLASNPLLPGDSTFWSHSNFNFPNGQFRLGNNDVLIWPTSATGSGTVDSDTLHHPIFVSNSAVFRLHDQGFSQMTMAQSPFGSYSFTAIATNLGEVANSNWIDLFVEIDGHSAIPIAEANGLYFTGDQAEFQVFDLDLMRIYHITEQQASALHNVKFFVMERETQMEPYNLVVVNFYEPMGLPAASVDELSVYPNPTNGLLKLQLPDGFEVTSIAITDFTGKSLLQSSEAIEALDVSGLAPGAYIVHANGTTGCLSRGFLKQ